MMMTGEELSRMKCAVLGSDSDLFLEYIFLLNLELDTASVANRIVQLGIDTGCVDEKTRKLTPSGVLVGDPIREYQFWRQRGRKLHGEAANVASLSAGFYEGKCILEIGSGFGCNLFSLANNNGKFVGVEPVGVYRQFTSIFAELEGIAAPHIAAGTAEAIPFPDETFDVVLCYSAHQYMDIRRALGECQRVLKPTGVVQIIGGTFKWYLNQEWRSLRENPGVWGVRRCVRGARTIANTWCYSVLERRLSTPRSALATTVPIHPTKRRMTRWMSEAGLQPQTDQFESIGGEMLLVASKS